ncbi:class I SAM-dependent methyltransferase [Candidatus Velamenicoccus archaeovorus]|uniref:class I SAM-dependent methyltransferase n=1 Tax=Velamenicoccus archaeovorus TaxID=1930593 RepID=UPI000FFF07AE|nr:class I SAM-dependent methyltransferase [Candidatus Velamenicoccus archaeovorus]
MIDRVKKHFQDEAGTFDARVVKSVPFYADMLEALVSALPFKKNDAKRILDLGCGTGSISKKIKEHFPKARITCVDFSENMLEIAKNKLRDFRDIRYVVSDVRTFDYSGFDAVVSSLTLHHLRRGGEKLKLYAKIRRGLRKGGVLYLADLVLGETDCLQRLNLEMWKRFLSRHMSEKDMNERRRRYEREDHPFKISDEMAWLKGAGFRHIDVVWKYYHFAVFGGQK